MIKKKFKYKESDQSNKGKGSLKTDELSHCWKFPIYQRNDKIPALVKMIEPKAFSPVFQL